MEELVRKVSLTSDEISWLNGLEAKIAKSIVGFYEVGFALIKIKDNRLYRDKYKTFEEYCRERWAFETSYANRLIKASYVIDNLKSDDDGFKNDHDADQGQIVPVRTNWPHDVVSSKLPTTESQVRPLSKLPNDMQKKAWQLALNSAGDKRVTAKDVSRAVSKVSDKEIGSATQRIKKRINQDELVSEEFKRCFMEFLLHLQGARDGEWKDTSKAAALNYIYSLKTVVEV